MTRKPQAGFTLIEMVVVLALLGMLMVGLGGGFGFFLRFTGQGEKNLDADMAVARTERLLRSQLGRALWLGKTDGAKGALSFRGDPDGVSFLAAQPAYPGEAGLYLVSFTAEDEAEGGQALRYTRLADGAGSLDPPPAGDEETAVLVEGPFRFRFSYFDGTGWQGAWQSRGQLPQMVRLRVLDAAGGGIAWPEITVRLASEGDPACPDPNLARLCRQGR